MDDHEDERDYERTYLDRTAELKLKIKFFNYNTKKNLKFMNSD